MITETAPGAIMEALADDSRRVLSQWRALVYQRRASALFQSSERRWQNTPKSIEDMRPVFRRMQNTGLIESLQSAPGCYVVMNPFARRFPIRERELLFELNPYAVLTHYSALEFHGFTLDQPKVITAWSGVSELMIPPGTTAEDWQGLSLPTAYKPGKVLSQRVRWTTRKFDASIGIQHDFDGPIPIRVTDRERTLIDALQFPEMSGGIANVLAAWEMSRDFVDIDTIVAYTERYNINLLKQRVGFVAETMGQQHPIFDSWAAASVRGGSSKLVGSEPFAPDYSNRWNISLNGPVELLVLS